MGRKARKLWAGRYAYRTYLIEEVSRDAQKKQPFWLISVALDRRPVDAADSLREAKAMIDAWFENSPMP